MPLMRPATVRVTDSFWKARQDMLLAVTLEQQYAQITSTPRLQNFQNAANKTGDFEGRVYDDSDVHKWIEACALALAAQPDHPNAGAVKAKMDSVVDKVLAAQLEDGYLHTYFQFDKAPLRFKSLNALHEMYCMGHFIEAAVAHHAATGSDRMLNGARKAADLLDREFGPNGKPAYCGHQEIELALIKLAEVTGEARYRKLAVLMLERRGTNPKFFESEIGDPEVAKLHTWCADRIREGGEYFQAHAPLKEQKTVVGHAVRAMYQWIAASQVADEMADSDAIKDSMRACWANMVERRMYITGGIGPSGDNEGFTHDYDLPNLSAYAETCASIGMALWGRTMAFATGESDFMDVAERSLYNGALSGISEAGDAYFYDNPLESRGRNQRVPWFVCACCPPNLARLIAQVGTFALSRSEDGLWIHVPMGIQGAAMVNGAKVEVSVESTYPATGSGKIRVSAAKPTKFKLRVRIPEWCDEAGFEGVPEEASFENGYAVFDRVWGASDELTFDFEMEPKWIDSHPAVLDNIGRSALMRGPVVFCLESVDNAALPQRCFVDLEEEVEVAEPFRLRAAGYALGAEERPLYTEHEGESIQETSLVFRPYHSWANNGASHMQVWVRRID